MALPLEHSVSSVVPAGDAQSTLSFNPADSTELISNGRRRAYFWRMHQVSTKDERAGGCGDSCSGTALLSYYSPPLRAADFKQAVGDFLASAFVPGGVQALTSTCDGDVVVWDRQGADAIAGTRASDRRAVKVVRLHAAPIRHLSCVGEQCVFPLSTSSEAPKGLLLVAGLCHSCAAWLPSSSP
jgi:cilia- and flagella-associated protein 251